MADVGDLASLRSRLYESYASEHAGSSEGRGVSLVYQRDIRPLLPSPASGEVLDIGCGQGELVRCLVKDGYFARGIDISPEQINLAHSAGLRQVRLGDYREELGAANGTLAAVTACDFLEHLTKPEVLEAFDYVYRALRPGGAFIARVPNAVSAMGGHIRYGDFTHESWYSSQSIRQLAAVAEFASVEIRSCPPVAHGLASGFRALAWKPISGFCKMALMAETGVLSGHIVTQNLTFSAGKAEDRQGRRAGKRDQ